MQPPWYVGEISGFHGGDYDGNTILGCCAVYSLVEIFARLHGATSQKTFISMVCSIPSEMDLGIIRT
jgi:hypothetical protein